MERRAFIIRAGETAEGAIAGQAEALRALAAQSRVENF